MMEWKTTFRIPTFEKIICLPAPVLQAKSSFPHIRQIALVSAVELTYDGSEDSKHSHARWHEWTT